MPAISLFEKGTLVGMLEGVGFLDVQLQHLTDNVLPRLRLLHILGRNPHRKMVAGIGAYTATKSEHIRQRGLEI